MSLVVMGASFKTMPLERLEGLSIPSAEIDNVLETLVSCDGVKGAVVLSTCNRTEIYVDARTDRLGIDACRAYFCGRLGIEPTAGALLAVGVYLERGEDVSKHLFRVVCSLDSQVLGEAQILGQVKNAYQRASEADTCTEVLTHLFKDALNVGKRVRTETNIGKDSVSISTVAFKTALREFDDVSACRVFFVGAGEMAALTLPYLREAGVTDFTVASRTMEHSREFAMGCNGKVIPFEERYDALAQVDLVFSSTAAPHCVIKRAELEEARAKANSAGRKLVIVDEAVPRDVEPECDEIDGVVLHNLEMLGQVIDEGMAARIAAVGAVERMAAEAEEGFLSWMQQRNVTPTIREMYMKGEATVESELVHAAKAFATQRGSELDAEEMKILEAFGSAVMKKILHGPTARLRREAETADSYYYTGAARYLFGLETYPAGCSPHECDDRQCLRGEPCEKGREA